jgi:3-deoxy-D-manno-octulosonic-acid transferase
MPISMSDRSHQQGFPTKSHQVAHCCFSRFSHVAHEGATQAEKYCQIGCKRVNSNQAVNGVGNGVPSNPRKRS